MQVFDLPELEPLLRAFDQKYVQSGLTYGWPSTHDKKDFGHWNKLVLKSAKHYLIDNTHLQFMRKHPEVQTIWNIIQSKIGRRKLLRVYINGYTYGTDAYIHKDDGWVNETYGDGTLSESVVVYLNETWDPDWSGETIVLGDDGEIEKSVLPKRNRVFAFDGNRPHGARPLSRSCPELRKVLVFKTLAMSAPTTEIDYVNRLYDGNSRLFYIAFKMSIAAHEFGYSKDVCLAALFHAVYDFEGTPRDSIKDIIGESAEQLVHDFHNKVNMDSPEMMRLEFLWCLRNNKDGSKSQRLEELWPQIQKLEQQEN